MFQIISTTETDQEHTYVLDRLHEQHLKSSFFKSDAFAFYIWKDENKKVNFAFHAPEDEVNTLQRALLKQFKENQVFSNDEGNNTEQLEYYKFYRKLKISNMLYSLKQGMFLEELLYDLPMNVAVEIQFCRSNQQNFKKNLYKEERRLQNIKFRSTDKKDRIANLAEKIRDSEQLFDVDIKLCFMFEEQIEKVLNFYKNLNTTARSAFNRFALERTTKTFIRGNFSPNMTLTKEELKGLIYIPKVIKSIKEYLYSTEMNIVLPTKNELTKGIKIGYVKHPFISKREIRLSESQYEKHVFVAGQTGSGKSAFLLEQTDDIVLTGDMGLVFMDPNEETLLKIINHALEYERQGEKIDWNRFVFLDLYDAAYVPSLNLYDTPEARTNIQQAINDKLELFKVAYNSGDTPQMDKIIRHITGTLLLAKKEPTILDDIYLLNNKEMQKNMMRTLKAKGFEAQEYLDFWKEGVTPSELNSTRNRLSMFITPTMKRLFGQPKSSLDFKGWADKKAIVLINTMGLGDVEKTFVGGHIVTQYFRELITRDGGNPLVFFADEEKQLQFKIIQRIVAEGRKFGAYHTGATQSIEQLDQDFSTEILVNTGTYLVGRHGAKGAKIMAAQLKGQVSSNEIELLPNNTMFFQTEVDGSYKTFKLNASLPYWYLPDGKVAEHKNADQEAIAKEGARKKALELQKRDFKSATEIDKLLAKRYSEIN